MTCPALCNIPDIDWQDILSRKGQVLGLVVLSLALATSLAVLVRRLIKGREKWYVLLVEGLVSLICLLLAATIALQYYTFLRIQDSSFPLTYAQLGWLIRWSQVLHLVKAGLLNGLLKLSCILWLYFILKMNRFDPSYPLASLKAAIYTLSAVAVLLLGLDLAAGVPILTVPLDRSSGELKVILSVDSILSGTLILLGYVVFMRQVEEEMDINFVEKCKHSTKFGLIFCCCLVRILNLLYQKEKLCEDECYNTDPAFEILLAGKVLTMDLLPTWLTLVTFRHSENDDRARTNTLSHRTTILGADDEY
jgi:hypothetical protein